jgi:hypothetical protein
MAEFEAGATVPGGHGHTTTMFRVKCVINVEADPGLPVRKNVFTSMSAEQCE